MDYSDPEAYPAHNESIDLLEYEKVRDDINNKYECDLSAIQVRTEFEIAYNKLFESMMEYHSHEIFNIIYVMMDCFNIDEIKAVRYLNRQNKEKLRAFAMNSRETFYYETIEKKNEKKKLEKKGVTYFEHDDIGDMFE